MREAPTVDSQIYTKELRRHHLTPGSLGRSWVWQVNETFSVLPGEGHTQHLTRLGIYRYLGQYNLFWELHIKLYSRFQVIFGGSLENSMLFIYLRVKISKTAF